MRERLTHLFDIVRDRTGHDIRRRIKIVLCQTMSQFERESSRMRLKKYEVPQNSSTVYAYYFDRDRRIIVSPHAMIDTDTFDTIALHEMFHHLYAHVLTERQIKMLREQARDRRGEIGKVFEQIQLKMPRNVEERLCYLFPFAVKPDILPPSARFNSLRKLATEIISPALISESVM